MLYHKSGIPLAVIEAKASKHETGKGMQQALSYAHLLNVPFAFASNGDGFIFHDKTVVDGELIENRSSWKSFHPLLYSGKNFAYGKVTPRSSFRSLPRTITTMVAEKHYAIISCRLSTKLLRPSLPGEDAFCWSWRPGRGKPIPLSRLSGVCGKQKIRSGYCSSRTGTFWWTRQKLTISSHLARR